MNRYKDLTGQKFGELTVIKLSDKVQGRSRMWVCQCSCGNITTVLGTSLRNGNTKSCGASIHKRKNIIGKTFGEYTVLEYVGQRKCGNKTSASLYLCQCSCGNKRIVAGNDLRNGSCLSCGHTRMINNNDYLGHKFGMLTPIKRIGSNPPKFECKCDCGNTIQVAQPLLRNGSSVSCGCLTKKKIGLANRKFNKIVRLDDHAEIYDSNGNIALIDICDIEKVQRFCWYMAPTGYFFGRTGTDMVSENYIALHRYLFDLSPKDKVFVDHINGNTRDNQRSNLRLCSPLENVWNGKLKKNNKTGVPGVAIVNGKFVVNAVNNGKRYHLGTFNNIKDAADARYKFEIENRGDFARLTWYDKFKEDGDKSVAT